MRHYSEKRDVFSLPITPLTASNIALFVMLVVVLFAPARRKAEVSAFRSKQLASLIGCLTAIPFVTQFAISAMNCQQNPSWQFSPNAVLTIILLSLARALAEEILYRWLLWSALSRIGLRTPVLILITAMIFTVFHAWKLTSWASWAYVFSGGLLFGLVRFVTDSILLVTVIHTCWNLAVHLLYGMTNVAGIPHTVPAVLCKSTPAIHLFDFVGITVSVAFVVVYLIRRQKV